MPGEDELLLGGPSAFDTFGDGAACAPWIGFGVSEEPSERAAEILVVVTIVGVDSAVRAVVVVFDVGAAFVALLEVEETEGRCFTGTSGEGGVVMTTGDF